MQALNQGHESVGTTVSVNVDVIRALIFQKTLLRITSVKGIAAHQYNHIDVTGFDRIRRPAHTHHTASAAVIAVQYPIHLQAKLLGHMRRVIRTHLSRDRETLDVFLVETRLL